MFRKQNILQPKKKKKNYYLWHLWGDHKDSKEGPKLSNYELAWNSFPTQCQFLWKQLMCPFQLSMVWNATAMRNIILDKERDHNWSHNLIYSTGGEGKPCWKLSNHFKGWMGKKTSNADLQGQLNNCLMKDFKRKLDSCIKIHSTSATLKTTENALLSLILLMIFSCRDRMVLRGWWAPSSHHPLPSPTTHYHQQLPASTDTLLKHLCHGWQLDCLYCRTGVEPRKRRDWQHRREEGSPALQPWPEGRPRVFSSTSPMYFPSISCFQKPL